MSRQRPARNTTIRDKHRKQIAKGQPPCWLCGEPIDYTLPASDPMSFVVDHKVSIHRGGADELSNKAAAHRVCNRDKGAKPHADIIRKSGSLKPARNKGVEAGS